MSESTTMAQTRPPERLLAIAAALFRTKGYGATTTRELAKLAGIQNASLYYHIGKKEDLLYAVCVDALNRICDEVQKAISREASPGERLRTLIRTHVVTALENQDKNLTMLVELRSLSSARREEVIQLRDAYESLVRQTIVDAQAVGMVRNDINASYLTLSLLNLLNWTTLWFKPDGPLTLEQLAELFTTIFLEGAVVRPLGSNKLPDLETLHFRLSE